MISFPPLPPLPKDVDLDSATKFHPKRVAHIEKQRRRLLLSDLLFPEYVPKICHVKVEGFVQLLHLLKTSPEKKSSLLLPSSSLSKDLYRSTISKCNLHLNRIEEVKQSSHQQKQKQKQQQYRKDGRAMKQPIGDGKKDKGDMDRMLETHARIHGLNYRHCIAKSACPKRTVALESCWKKFGPEGFRIMIERSLVPYICREEREAVERCCGEKVQSFMRNVLD